MVIGLVCCWLYLCVGEIMSGVVEWGRRYCTPCQLFTGTETMHCTLVSDGPTEVTVSIAAMLLPLLHYIMEQCSVILSRGLKGRAASLSECRLW